MNYNVKTIEYKDSVQVRTYRKPVQVSNKIKKCTFQDKIAKEAQSDKPNRTLEEIRHSMQVSVNRTVNQIYSIARSNKWEYFVTLTINPEILDNTDYKLICEKLNIWTNNLRKRYAPNLKYLFVPELHKDKSKWHFHGLFSDIGKMPLVFSGKVCIGKYIYDYVRKPYATKIYNVPLWKYGYSTVTLIRDSSKAGSYIAKYITKDVSHILQNQHRFMASQNIEKPVEQVYNIDFSDLENVYKGYLEQINYISDVKIPKAGQEILYMEFNKRFPDQPLQDVIFHIFENKAKEQRVNICQKPEHSYIGYKETDMSEHSHSVLNTETYIRKLQQLRSDIKRNPHIKKIYDDVDIDFLIAKAKKRLNFENEKRKEFTYNESDRQDNDEWIPAVGVPFE